MKKILLTLILLFITGCATPYQKLGDTGGYLQQKFSDDCYKVKFHGNGFTERKRVQDFALLRAAEIGQELGYSYLTIEGEEDVSKTSTMDMGSNSYTTGSVYGYGTSKSYTGHTTTYNNSMPITKPSTTIVAKYYESEPEGKHLEIHRVEEVINTMKAKYGLKPNPL